MFFSEVERRFDAMPFTLRYLTAKRRFYSRLISSAKMTAAGFVFFSRRFRALEDEAKARLGVVECAKHELLQPFSVLNEKEGELCLLLR